MQYIQLFAELQGGTGGYGSYRELDLYAEEPIKFSRSIQAVEEPQAVTSDFSRTFRVPATSVNGQYFKAAFNVNSTDYDPTLKANAYINIDGAYFTSGNIRLTGIFRNDRTGKIEYEIVFMGETSNFASIVAPKNMSEINLSSLGHEYSIANVFLSWEAAPGSLGGLKNGDVLYPLCEWGYTYSSDGVPNENTLSVWTGTTGPGGSTKGFTNGNFPLSITQFKPAVRAKKIWDTIFEEAGYTYESQFLDSMFFQNIYMISTDQSTSYSTVVNIAKTDVGMLRTGVPSLPLNQYALIDKYTEFFDANNAFDSNRGIYTVPTTGFYTIEAEITLDYRPSGASPGTGYKNFVFALFRNGVVSITNNGFVPSQNNIGFHSVKAFSQTTPTTSTLFNFSGSYTEGEILDFRLFLPQYYFTEASIYSGTITFNGPSRMVPTGLMPSQYKQIDFIKGINDRFKLMWEPDPENPKKFRIEPWVEWIRSGRQIDWTDKLDESKDLKIEPLFYTQSREIIFKDSEEADIYNFSYQQNNKQVFGQLDQDSGIELITGTKTLSNFFAPMPLAPLGNSQKFLVPHFAKVQSDQRQPIQVKPRLVFYNGMQPAPYNWYIEGNGIPFIQTKYPLVSQFSSYPFDNNAFDLNWTNVPQFWNPADNTSSGITGGTAMSGRTALTAYTNYWSEWFTETYNPYSRIMEGYFVLSNSDIQNLRFNDVIFIKDSWWFPVKLTDYSLGAKQSVKVQLIKLASLPLQITQTITTSSTTTTTTSSPTTTTTSTTTTSTTPPPTTTTTSTTTTTTTFLQCCYGYEITNYYTTSVLINYTDCTTGPTSVSAPGNGQQTYISCAVEGSITYSGVACNGGNINCIEVVQASSPCNGCTPTTTTTTTSTTTSTTTVAPPTTTTTTSTTTSTTTLTPECLTLIVPANLNSFARSTDGTNWTRGNVPGGTGDGWTIAQYSPELNRWAMLGGNGSAAYSDDDGITWQRGTIPSGPNGGAAVFTETGFAWSPSLGLFVAGAKDSVGPAQGVIKSTDGINWTWETISNDQFRIQQVIWVPVYNRFVALRAREDGFGSNVSVVTSATGTGWTVRTTPVAVFRVLAYSPEQDLIVAVGDSNQSMTSTGGLSWTQRPMNLSTPNEFNAINWGASLGKFSAVGSVPGNAAVPQLANGINWTLKQFTDPTGDWKGIFWSSLINKFILLRANSGVSSIHLWDSNFTSQQTISLGFPNQTPASLAARQATCITTSTTTTTTTSAPLYNYYEFTPCIGGSPLLYRSTSALALFDVYTFAAYPPDRACYSITSITATPNTNDLPTIYGPLADCNDENCIQV